MKKEKIERNKGISLIVLVITIIVMIILAATIIISLNNNGIINNANEAVDKTNYAQIKTLAQTLWADAYLDGKSGSDLVDAVQDGLLLADKNYATKYDVLITDSGVTVTIKGSEDEPNEEKTEIITQLSKPAITISENTLVIVDNATNGSNTAGFEIYVGSEKKATVTTTTYDLTTLELTAGTYSITVKAIAAEGSTISASEASEAVQYVIEEQTPTLGELVASAANYGDKVNYTVTVNAGTQKETTINKWRVFYKQTVQNATTGTSEEYVYLIASEKLAANAIPEKLADTVSNGGAGASINGQNINWTPLSLGSTRPSPTINKDLWLANWNNGVYNTSPSTNPNEHCVAFFLDEQYWTSFKNTDGYKDANGNTYVVGAIGTPTAEMFVASWNAKRLTETNTDKKKLSLDPNGTIGYYVNDITTSGSETTTKYFQTITTTDDLYVWSTNSGTSIWLASPAAGADALLNVLHNGYVYMTNYDGVQFGVRPVVCLKSNIPAYVQGEGDAKTIILDVD